ncbi:MAG: gliding motility protein GldL [Prevotella sp.]|nr:gliding motility protein GldL [Prevotella sp.]
MTKYSKFNPIYRLQKWLDSVPGQTFMNYAYSWGASIVILGALFKLTHLPGANLMLFLGMGTEVLVFFIAGFDRPFDKTEDGKELPTHVVDDENETGVASGQAAAVIGTGGGGITGGGSIGGGTIVIGGGGASSGVAASTEAGEAVEGHAEAAAVAGTPVIAGGIIGTVNQPELPDIDPEEMEEATQNYVEQLKNLTETLKKVSEQSERLTRDSEEMENLNRTLTGICKVYEMQLKGASQQIGTIDQINEQSKRMAEQIAELNKIYTRMIEAMTVNMPKTPPTL